MHACDFFPNQPEGVQALLAIVTLQSPELIFQDICMQENGRERIMYGMRNGFGQLREETQAFMVLKAVCRRFSQLLRVD
jgi:hypothetical protein